MRSYRGLIIAAAVVVLAGALAIAIGTIWLNSFIHSAAFQQDVQGRASQSVGGPVTFTSVDFDIIHGVKLRGLVTQIDAAHVGGQGDLKVQVAQVNLTYSLWELLTGQLRLTGVMLDQPQIVFSRQASAPPPAETSTPSSGSSGGNANLAPKTADTSMPFQFILDHAAVKDGSVQVSDAAGISAVSLSGINARADTAGYYDGRDVTGKLRIAQVTASGLTVTNFETPITYHTNFIEAKPFEADAYRGTLKGDYLSDGSSPSVLNLNANGVDAGQLAAATSSRSAAHLTGTLDLQSKWRGIETSALDGEGDLQLANGHLEGVRFLQEASHLLRVKELESPQIDKAQTHFVVQGRQVKFIGLQLESTLFKITGDGTANLDGPLDANLVLVLSRDAMARLPHEVASSFVAQPDGTGSIAFRVFGTMSDPQTDLPTRLLLQNGRIQNAINKALNKLFR
jgi:hypothetical protein